MQKLWMKGHQRHIVVAFRIPLAWIKVAHKCCKSIKPVVPFRDVWTNEQRRVKGVTVIVFQLGQFLQPARFFQCQPLAHRGGCSSRANGIPQVAQPLGFGRPRAKATANGDVSDPLLCALDVLLFRARIRFRSTPVGMRTPLLPRAFRVGSIAALAAAVVV